MAMVPVDPPSSISPTIPIEYGDGRSEPNGRNIPQSQIVPCSQPSPGGETQLDSSPEAREERALTQHVLIHSIEAENIPIEDDEMLEMQIQLGEVQERTLKRKIEHKRRKASPNNYHHSWVSVCPAGCRRKFKGTDAILGLTKMKGTEP